MGKFKKVASVLVLVVATANRLAPAATVTITPAVVRYWANETAFTTDQNDGTTIHTSPIPGSQFEAGGGIYEISLGVTTSLSSADIAAGYTGLQAAFFDLNQGASALPSGFAQDANAGGGIYDRALKYNSAGTKYQYSDPITGASVSAGTGAVPGSPMFSTVADAGTPGDFKGLQLAMGSGTYSAGDPRLNATQNSQNSTLTGLDGLPLQVFDVFVDYNGSSFNTIQPYASSVTEGFSLHNNSTGTAAFFPTGTAGQTYVLQPLVWPEPTSIGLTVFGGFIFTRRSRPSTNTIT